MRSMARYLASITRGLVSEDVGALTMVPRARKRAARVLGSEAGNGLVSGAVSRSDDAATRRRPCAFSAS
jgi:hypothetical protein